jgi:hypothetical protein
MNDLKRRYRKQKRLKEFYDTKKGDELTFHISLKRAMAKKSQAAQRRLERLLNKKRKHDGDSGKQAERTANKRIEK